MNGSDCATNTAFEAALFAVDDQARQSVAVEAAGGFAPGDSVMIVASVGEHEADGVPDGTRGEFRGLLRLDGLEVRAAIGLDDNGGLVFVEFRSLLAI